MISTLIDVLGLLILIAGLVVSIQAVRRKKNAGFLMIACWFTLSIVFMGISKAREARYNRQIEQLPPPPAGAVRCPVKTVSIPIMPAILVAGVWLAGREKNGKEKQNMPME